jgi:hypothetical protein
LIGEILFPWLEIICIVEKVEHLGEHTQMFKRMVLHQIVVLTPQEQTLGAEQELQNQDLQQILQVELQE